jgi:hypothetical protein
LHLGVVSEVKLMRGQIDLTSEVLTVTVNVAAGSCDTDLYTKRFHSCELAIGA